jgi:transcription termination factor Rho
MSEPSTEETATAASSKPPTKPTTDPKPAAAKKSAKKKPKSESPEPADAKAAKPVKTDGDAAAEPKSAKRSKTAKPSKPAKQAKPPKSEPDRPAESKTAKADDKTAKADDDAPAKKAPADESGDPPSDDADSDNERRRFGRVKGGPVKRGRRRGKSGRRGDRRDGNDGNSGGNNGGKSDDSGNNRGRRGSGENRREKENRPPQLTGPKTEWGGLLEIAPKGFGFLRRPEKNFEQARDDVFVPPELIRRHGLRVGSWISGFYREGSRGPQLVEVTAVNGQAPETAVKLPFFEELKAINPERRIVLETASDRFTTRVIDLVSPVARGQRGLIVSPPRSGKTTVLLHTAEAIREQYQERETEADNLHLMVLLVDERPEEVTEFRRALPGTEVFASSNDESPRNHCRIAEIAIERAKRLVEAGKHVFLLMDSITRLARAYNNTMRKKGRGTGSGGITVGALEVPRRLFAAARNTREAGSLTVLATALVQTNSRADDAIFQEFKGTGNMELVLDRKIAESYIYPAVDIFKSGTRREELILPEHTLHKIHLIRRGLAGHKPVEAMERLLFFLNKFPNNAQMLIEIKG